VGKKSEYEIAFVGLRDGKHHFHFKIDDTFFEHFDTTDIEGADLELDMELEKEPTMLQVRFQINGKLKVMCDRCTDSFFIPVNGQDDLIYKFTEKELDNEKVIALSPTATEIDITQPVYEFVSLLLPYKRVHPEGECNEEMLNEINNYLMVEEDEEDDGIDEEVMEEEQDEIDPRWAELKKLKRNND
jgi:uncharacterized metal-binding protein YceD (DUF177 family)